MGVRLFLDQGVSAIRTVSKVEVTAMKHVLNGLGNLRSLEYSIY